MVIVFSQTEATSAPSDS